MEHGLKLLKAGNENMYCNNFVTVKPDLNADDQQSVTLFLKPSLAWLQL